MNIGLIFAGGKGQRMKSRDFPKQFLEMHGKPIIIYTLEHFERHAQIDAIVIACKVEWIDYLKELLERFHITKVKAVVPGGSSGQDSIYNGLVAAKKVAEEYDASCADELSKEKHIVLIHDGVRPLINEKVITDNIASVKANGSAITTAVVKETILVVSDDNSIDYVPDRSKSRVAKAPQSFFLTDILSAHEHAREEGKHDFIDSCTMMQYYDHSLFLVDGPGENIKITTPDDFYTMRALLDAQENQQLYIEE